MSACEALIKYWCAAIPQALRFDYGHTEPSACTSTPDCVRNKHGRWRSQRHPQLTTNRHKLDVLYWPQSLQDVGVCFIKAHSVQW